jgi:protein-L-isoaspartate(D-aspartate) O-methyltransferase
MPQKWRIPRVPRTFMTDFATARRMMVDGQIRTADVTDRSLLAAFLDVPRERFCPADKASLAYMDLDVLVSEPGQLARYLVKPMVLGKLIQAIEVAASDRVLDVGCATGYSTALLSRLATAVVGLEEDDNLARQAREALAELGCADAKIAAGPLTRGFAAGAPYDAIALQGSVEVVPEALLVQLKDGGRLACVLGRGPGAKAMVYRSIGGEISGRPIFDAAAPPLPGFAKPPSFVF